MHSIFHGSCPDYLFNIVSPVVSRSCAGLQSSSTTNFAMPQLRTKCGERAFSHAGPAAWNALQENMRAVSDFVLCRKQSSSTLCFRFAKYGLYKPRTGRTGQCMKHAPAVLAAPAVYCIHGHIVHQAKDRQTVQNVNEKYTPSPSAATANMHRPSNCSTSNKE